MVAPTVVALALVDVTVEFPFLTMVFAAVGVMQTAAWGINFVSSWFGLPCPCCHRRAAAPAPTQPDRRPEPAPELLQPPQGPVAQPAAPVEQQPAAPVEQELAAPVEQPNLRPPGLAARVLQWQGVGLELRVPVLGDPVPSWRIQRAAVAGWHALWKAAGGTQQVPPTPPGPRGVKTHWVIIRGRAGNSSHTSNQIRDLVAGGWLGIAGHVIDPVTRALFDDSIFHGWHSWEEALAYWNAATGNQPVCHLPVRF